MASATTERRKYIIGWLILPPGTREDFMKLVLPYAAACRAEPGCRFFEMNPSITDPDVVTFAECFESAEAHAAHHKTPWFEAMWGEINRRCRHGRFENIFPGRVEPESVDFEDRDREPVT